MGKKKGNKKVEQSHNRVKRIHNKTTRGINTRKKKVKIDTDELKLQWQYELFQYVLINDYRLYKEKLIGRFAYQVYDRAGNHILTIESTKDISPSKKRRRRKGPERIRIKRG